MSIVVILELAETKKKSARISLNIKMKKFSFTLNLIQSKPPIDF